MLAAIQTLLQATKIKCVQYANLGNKIHIKEIKPLEILFS